MPITRDFNKLLPPYTEGSAFGYPLKVYTEYSDPHAAILVWMESSVHKRRGVVAPQGANPVSDLQREVYSFGKDLYTYYEIGDM